MTRVLVWKEVREQSLSLIAVLVLGVGLMLSRDSFGGPWNASAERAEAVLLVMAWISGLIAGVQPFAVERESKTLSWLDALPVTRRQLWRAKALASIGISLVVPAVLFVMMVRAVFFPPNESAVKDVLPVLLVTLNGWACGLFGSAVAHTPMAAFGWALVVQSITATIFVIAMWLPDTRTWWPIRDVLVISIGAAMAVVPAMLSARLFGRLDRLRARAARQLGGPADGWRAAAWLTSRQCHPVWWGVTVAGVALSTFLPAVAPHLWPLFGLALGIMAGIGTFGADQGGAAYSFLGDRRLPGGRLWWTKQAIRFSALAIVLFAYFASGQVRIRVAEMGHLRHYDDYLVENLHRLYDPTLLLFGPVVGYSLAQFVGMVCRKQALATVVAVLAGAAVAALWLPSLIVGGVRLWQWVVPPLLLLAATRLVMWPWLTGRLGNWKSAAGLTVVIVLAVAGTVGGVAYRLVEAPVRVPPFDVAAFEASLPKPEENEAGREIKRAITRFQNHFSRVNADYDIRSPGPYDDWKFPIQIGDAVTKGNWPADSAELDRWLDAVLNDAWVDQLQDAVNLPLGVVALGRAGPTSAGFDYQPIRKAVSAGTFLAARGLRRCSRGEFEPALEDFALALDYCRQLRNLTTDQQFLEAARLESQVIELLPGWASKASGRPDLLRRAIEKLRTHEAGLPPVADTVKVDYLAALDWEQSRDYRTRGQPQSLEQGLHRAALSVPWELYRNRCIEDTLFAGFLRTAETTYRDALQRISAANPEQSERLWILRGWTPPSDEASARAARRRIAELLPDSDLWISNSPAFVNLQVFIQDARNRTQLRAAQLQMALILYQAKKGEPAVDLAVLVPDILPALPADPFGEGQFKYRVSEGERVVWSRRTTDDPEYRDMPAGQGIVWSVGPDLQDNGGRVNEASFWWHPGLKPGADILFPVPVVKK